MAGTRALVFDCDAPLCNVDNVIAYPGQTPVGFSGKAARVLGQPGDCPDKADWYACKAEHIEAAIVAALNHEHRRIWQS